MKSFAISRWLILNDLAVLLLGIQLFAAPAPAMFPNGGGGTWGGSIPPEFWSSAFSGAPFHSRPASPSSNITLLSSSITSITSQTTGLSDTSTASIPGATTTTTALPQSSHTTRIPNGAIAGIVVGIILLLLSFVAIIVFLRRRARKLEKAISSETIPEPYVKIEDSEDMRPSLTAPERTLSRSKRTLRHPSPTSHEHIPSSQPLQPPLEDSHDTVESHPTVSPLDPAWTGSFAVDTTSLPELVERVTRAILSDPQLGHTNTGEEEPPHYEE